MSTQRPTIIATSLKMYFDHEQTLAWAHEVREIALNSSAVQDGLAHLLVFPSFPSIAALVEIFDGVPISVGAQNMAAHARGAFTGEVGVHSLKQVGCSYVELSHAERRRFFGETTAQTQDKVALAFEHGLVPLLCVGEYRHMAPEQAALECTAFIEQAIARVPLGRLSAMVLAYEPEWAIGAEKPADTTYVREVAAHLRRWLESRPELAGSSLIYGGSAGPGLLHSLHGSVDGLFLGRFAHDPLALQKVLQEV